MTPSIYINLEDTVATIAGRVKRQRSDQVILVCPKHCFLFTDPINLKLLKTELDLAAKQAAILTMDEKGRTYAQAAGFALREVPGAAKLGSTLDIKPRPPQEVAVPTEIFNHQPSPALLGGAAQELKTFVKKFSWPAPPETKIQASPMRVAAPVVSTDQAQTPAQPSFQMAPVSEQVPEVFEAEAPEVKDTIFPKEFEQKIRAQQQAKASRRLAAWLVFTAVIVLLAVIFVVLPKATVTVYPKTENLSRDLDISLSAAAASPDASQLVLPAIKVSESMQAADVFQSQGKKQVGSKADGTVKIYNFTKAAINLKSQTTTLTLNGKIYTLVPALVSVKPTKYSNSATKEVDPNSLGDSVEITASEGGEASNIPAGTRLEIANQVFGSKPHLLYAKTDSPVTGGESRYLSVVTDQDLAAAQDQLKQTMLTELRGKLAAQSLTFLDNAYTIQIASFTTDKPVNTESPTFTAEASGTVSGLAFKIDDLSKLIFNRVQQSITGNKTLTPDPNLSASYRIKSFDFGAGAAVLTAHFQSQAVDKVNVDGLPATLVGKTPAQVNQILTAQPSIDRIDVTLAPSWQKTFPWFKQKILVNLAN